MKERIIAFILILVVLFSALFCPIQPVEAANDVIDDLVYYALTVSGYLETDLVNSGGGGHSYGKGASGSSKTPSGGNLFTELRDAFQYAYDNHNISVDDSGNYVFDETITNNFYNIINGGSGIGGFNARFLSVNPLFNDFINSPNVDGNYINAVKDIKSLYSDYIFMAYGIERTDWRPLSTLFCAFDVSSVAYVYYNCKNNGVPTLYFYDSNLQPISVSYCYVTQFCDYYGRKGNIYTTSGTTTCTPSFSEYRNGILSNLSISFSREYTFDYFPNVGNSCFFTSSEDVLVGASESDSRGAYLYMKTPDRLTSNNYNVFPSIPSGNSTNWQDCYNSYVNNVNNYYNTDNTDWDTDKFKEAMIASNQQIIDALEQGVSDVTGVIETLNEKVQRVLEAIKEIQSLMENGSGGGSASGSSSSFTSEQVTELLTNIQSLCDNQVSLTVFNETLSDVVKYLKSIDSGTAINTTELQALNQQLTDLYDFLVYGDPDNGKQSPYEIIKNLYETVASLSVELTQVKDDNADLKMSVINILELLQDILSKEDTEIDYSESLQELSDYIKDLNIKIASISDGTAPFAVSGAQVQISQDQLAELKEIQGILQVLVDGVYYVDPDTGEMVPFMGISNDLLEELNDTESSNYDVLFQIQTQLDRIYARIPRRYMDIDVDLDDFVQPEKLQDYIDMFIDEALTDTLQAAVPLCFLVAMGALIDGLAREPVAPEFTIPVAISETSFADEAGLSSDYAVGIDLSEWEKPHMIIENMYCIMFVLLLMYMSFRLVKWVISVFA